MVKYIEDAKQQVLDRNLVNLNLIFKKFQGHNTVIYCAAGVSRSATLTIVYLMVTENLSLEEAYLQVNQVSLSRRKFESFWNFLGSSDHLAKYWILATNDWFWKTEKWKCKRGADQWQNGKTCTECLFTQSCVLNFFIILFNTIQLFSAVHNHWCKYYSCFFKINN